MEDAFSRFAGKYDSNVEGLEGLLLIQTGCYSRRCLAQESVTPLASDIFPKREIMLIFTWLNLSHHGSIIKASYAATVAKRM